MCARKQRRRKSKRETEKKDWGDRCRVISTWYAFFIVIKSINSGLDTEGKNTRLSCFMHAYEQTLHRERNDRLVRAHSQKAKEIENKHAHAHARMYARMYACTHSRTYASTHMRTNKHAHTSTRALARTSTHAHKHANSCRHALTQALTCARTSTHVHTHTRRAFIHADTHVCTHVHKHVLSCRYARFHACTRAHTRRALSTASSSFCCLTYTFDNCRCAAFAQKKNDINQII